MNLVRATFAVALATLASLAISWLTQRSLAEEDRGLRPHIEHTEVSETSGQHVDDFAANEFGAEDRRPVSLPPCNRFVALNGSDSSPSGSFSAPFKTAGKLFASLTPGQTGCFRAGTHVFGVGRVTTPGVILRPYGTEAVTLKGSLQVMPEASGATIEGFILDGRNIATDPHGPKLFADDTVLRDNEITNHDTGICVQVLAQDANPEPPERVLIESNRIHDCGKLTEKRKNLDHGIYVEDSRGAIIRDNWIYDNRARGVQLYPDADDTLVTGNVIDGNGQGVIFSCGPADLLPQDQECAERNLVEGNVISNATVSFNVGSHSPRPGLSPAGSNILRDNCVQASSPAQPEYAEDNGIESDRDFLTEADNVPGPPRFRDRSAGDFVLAAPTPAACLEKYTGTMSLPGTAP